MTTLYLPVLFFRIILFYCFVYLLYHSLKPIVHNCLQDLGVVDMLVKCQYTLLWLLCYDGLSGVECSGAFKTLKTDFISQKVFLM